MKRKSRCYLIWHEGYLTCTVLHRDYNNCDLNQEQPPMKPKTTELQLCKGCWCMVKPNPAGFCPKCGSDLTEGRP